jgi:peptide/nickel transport system substrate-binding protein
MPSLARRPFLLCCVLLLASCSHKAQPQALRQQLVVHAETEPRQLISMLLPDGWAHRITAHNVLESLIRIDPRTYQFTGELASTWTAADEGKRYTFYLRQGVKWHDGQPFTGEDVVFTFDRVMDEKVSAAGTRALLEPFVQSYKLVKPDQFEIVCKQRSPFFLVALSEVTILPAHLMRRGDLNTHPLLRRPVGTGPYRFASWQAGQQLTLERFDGYWGAKPRIPKVIYRFITSPDTALKLARRGELDFLSRLRAAQWVGTVQKDPVLMHEFVVTHHFPPGTSYIMLNHKRPLFADVRVRRALAKLLDLPTITGKILHGLGTPVGGLYWVKDPGYDEKLSPIAFDPPGAGKLLGEAGWKAGEDGVLARDGKPLRFTYLLVAGSENNKLWATLYQQDLRKAGVVMEISTIDWAAFVERIRKHDFDAGALFMQQSGPFTDLYYQLHSSQIDDGQNYQAYSSPAVDRLLEQTRSELDSAHRRELGLKLQRLLYEDTPVIPLFALDDPGLVARRVHGVYSSALWYQIRDWWIE